MITTKQINVNLSRGKLKLRRVTTKDVDASLRVEPPRQPLKLKNIPSITTTTLSDVADIAEKKRRDDIAKEKKLAMGDEKKIAIVEKKATPVIKIDDRKLVSLIADEIAQMPPIAEKKSWKDMSDDEKKIAYKERAQRAKATREAKKKKKDEKK